jgi:hypothetical protein
MVIAKNTGFTYTCTIMKRSLASANPLIGTSANQPSPSSANPLIDTSANRSSPSIANRPSPSSANQPIDKSANHPYPYRHLIGTL